MAEPGELPDWLIQLRDQQFGEPPEQPQQPQESAPPPSDRPPDWFEDLSARQEPEPEEQPQGPVDVLEDLREQIIQADEELEAQPKQSPLMAMQTAVRRLPSWQRLVLSILVFLDVAVCGCMLLTMMGKVAF